MPTLTADDFASAALDTRAVGGGARNPITLTDFKRAIYRRYIHAPHLEKIDWALTQATLHAETQGAQGLAHILVEMPPRKGKTVTISRLYPPWHLGRNPDQRVILASYGATLAHKNSRYARNVMLSPRYMEIFHDVLLAEGSKSAEAWDIAFHEGGLDAMGVGGGVTGKGGHIIVVDDPVKSREEAESEVYREKVWDWFTDDIYSRREPGCAIVVVMTRWHMDDLAGRLLKQEPEKWHEIRLAELAEPDDPLGRAEGDVLWPERFPLPMMLETKRMMGEYSWAALYQQRPVPAEGGLFKRAWFEPWLDSCPPIVRAVRYWDLAMSEKTSADYTAGIKIGIAEDGHRYILDVARGQIEWGELTGFMANVMMSDGAEVMQGIEEKGFMTRAIQELNLDPRLKGYAIFGYPKDKDKFTAALPFAAKCGAGLYHVLNRHWTSELIDELCSFPMGANDDQVDAGAGAESMLESGVSDTATSFGGQRTGLEGAW